MRSSLFDQLYESIDIGVSPRPEAPRQSPMVPAQRTPEAPGIQTSTPNDFTGMKFTHSLIKHLDQLYSKMLAGEVGEMAAEQNNPKQKVIEGQTDQIVLNEKESYYSPGNSNVTESM